MARSIAVGLAVFLLSWPGMAVCMPLPAFNLELSAWNATHIVIVTEGGKIDGVVEIIDCWKGDLKKGDRISIRELAKFAPLEARAVSRHLFRAEADTDMPTNVSGGRMVLFLRKQTRSWWTPIKWQSANEWGSIKEATVWIEKDKAFAFKQQSIPGPLRLIFLGIREFELKRRVQALMEFQINLSQTVADTDAGELVGKITPLLKSDSEFLRDRVIQALGEGGKKCLPALRVVLRDQSLLRNHESAVFTALVKAGGQSVAPELTAIISQELAFWAKTGPKLKEGWWNGEGLIWDEVDGLRDHYCKTMAALDALGPLKFAPCLEQVMALRKLWQSLPQLRFEQLDNACEGVLRAHWK